MRICLGAQEEWWGTVSLLNGKLHYEDAEQGLRAFVEGLRQEDMDDADLLASLPRRLNSPYAWAVDLDAPPPLPTPPTPPTIRPWEIEDWDDEMEAAANEARAAVAHMADAEE